MIYNEYKVSFAISKSALMALLTHILSLQLCHFLQSGSAFIVALHLCVIHINKSGSDGISVVSEPVSTYVVLSILKYF